MQFALHKRSKAENLKIVLRAKTALNIKANRERLQNLSWRREHG